MGKMVGNMWAIWWAMWANTGNPVLQNDVVSAVFLFTQADQTDKKRDGCFDKQEKMLTRVWPGYPPFYDDNPFGIYEKILSGKLEWPRHVEMTAKDLVKRLLVQVMMTMLTMVIMMLMVMMTTMIETTTKGKNHITFNSSQIFEAHPSTSLLKVLLAS